MAEFHLTTDLVASGDVADTDLEAAFGSIMNALVDLCGPGRATDDPALSLDLDARRLAVELLVRADEFAASCEVADAMLHAAVRAAGYGTSAWLTKRSPWAERASMNDSDAAAFESDVFGGIVHERSEIAELELAATARCDAEQRVLDAVREARRRGVPWTVIGAGLGVSDQSAIQKYRDKI